MVSTVKYHYFHRFFTYSVGRSACAERHSWPGVTVFSCQALGLRRRPARVGQDGPSRPASGVCGCHRSAALVPRAIRSEDTARRGV